MSVVKLDEKMPEWAQQAIAKLEKLAARLASYSNPAAHMECDRIAALIRQNASLSAQGEEVATVEAWSHGETYLHWHTSAMEFPAGAKLYLHPAPPGSDAVTEEMAADVLHRFNATAPSGDHWPPERARELRVKAMQQAITNAALAARTGKGEANG